MSTENKITLDKLGKIISIVIGVHYFLSYKWFSGMLNIWGIDYLNIITFEDLTFPFVKVNILLFVFCFFGTIGTFYVYFLKQDKEPYENLNEFYSSVKKWFIYKKKSSKFLLILGLLLSIIILGILFYKDYIYYPKNKLEIIYFLILIAPPIAYLFVEEKIKNIVFYVQLGFLFLWANIFIDKIISDVEKNTNQEKNNIKISFTYNNELIDTKSLNFIFHSHKFLIMQKNNGEIQLFKNKNIGQLNIKIKDKNH